MGRFDVISEERVRREQHGAVPVVDDLRESSGNAAEKGTASAACRGSVARPHLPSDRTNETSEAHVRNLSLGQERERGCHLRRVREDRIVTEDDALRHAFRAGCKQHNSRIFRLRNFAYGAGRRTAHSISHSLSSVVNFGRRSSR